MSLKHTNEALQRIAKVILNMVDPDIIVWKERNDTPSNRERYRAATIIADRLCGAVANPIIRNAQEARQLNAIEKWLTKRDYDELPEEERGRFEDMPLGTFSFRMNVHGRTGRNRRSCQCSCGRSNHAQKRPIPEICHYSWRQNLQAISPT